MRLYKQSIMDFDTSEYEKWLSYMSEEGKKRVGRLCHEDDRKRTVLGEKLVREAIFEHCGIDVRDVIIKRADSGKPFCANADLQFNVSHSGDIVVAAVSRREVGVDVERIRERDLSIARRFCSKGEIEYIFGMPECKVDTAVCDGEALVRFYEVWTAKEAYAKCIGTGLTDFKTDIPPSVTVYKTVNDGYVITVIENQP